MSNTGITHFSVGPEPAKLVRSVEYKHLPARHLFTDYFPQIHPTQQPNLAHIYFKSNLVVKILYFLWCLSAFGRIHIQHSGLLSKAACCLQSSDIFVNTELTKLQKVCVPVSPGQTALCSGLLIIVFLSQIGMEKIRLIN